MVVSRRRGRGAKKAKSDLQVSLHQLDGAKGNDGDEYQGYVIGESTIEFESMPLLTV